MLRKWFPTGIRITLEKAPSKFQWQQNCWWISDSCWNDEEEQLEPNLPLWCWPESASKWQSPYTFFLVMNWDKVNWYNFVCPCVQDATEPASTMQVVINGTRCLFIRWNRLQLPAWDENALNSTELRALGKSTLNFGITWKQHETTTQAKSQHSQTFVELGKPTEFRASEHRISAQVLWRVGSGASQRHVTSADFIHQVTLWFQRSGTTSQPLVQTKKTRPSLDFFLKQGFLSFFGVEKHPYVFRDVKGILKKKLLRISTDFFCVNWTSHHWVGVRVGLMANGSSQDQVVGAKRWGQSFHGTFVRISKFQILL